MPAWPKLDFEEAQAARPNFVLVGNASRAEHDGEGSVLGFLAAVAFTIVAFEQQRKKRKLMRVGREFAGDRMTKIGEDGAALLALALYEAEETAGAHVLAVEQVAG